VTEPLTLVCRWRSRPSERGVVLLALLLTLALGGIALMAAVDVWSLSRQRQREEELLFVGDQYRQAIQRYYFGAPPGTPRVLPTSLEQLLADDRFPEPVHHLRRLYPDPITGSTEWGLVLIRNRIAGVHSLSEREPVKKAGFTPAYQQLSDKVSYRDWLFAIGPDGRPIFSTRPFDGPPARGTDPFTPPTPVRRTPS